MAKAFMNSEEACAHLGCTEDDLKTRILAGDLREFRDAGKKFFKTDDVLQLKPAEPAKPLTFDDARVMLSNAIYDAADLIERWEREGLLHGNGHHIRQDLAAAATEVLRQRWNNKKEAESSWPPTPDSLTSIIEALQKAPK